MKMTFLSMLLLTTACSNTPRERGMSTWSESVVADARRSPSHKPDKPKMIVGYTGTYGEFAADMGVDLEIISVAQYACMAYNRCNPDEAVHVLGCTERKRKYCKGCACQTGCDVPMLQAWCPGDTCKFGKDDDPRWDACREEMNARVCEDIDKPLTCPIVRELGLTIRPTDFLWAY